MPNGKRKITKKTEENAPAAPSTSAAPEPSATPALTTSLPVHLPLSIMIPPELEIPPKKEEIAPGGMLIDEIFCDYNIPYIYNLLRPYGVITRISSVRKSIGYYIYLVFFETKRDAERAIAAMILEPPQIDGFRFVHIPANALKLMGDILMTSRKTDEIVENAIYKK